MANRNRETNFAFNPTNIDISRSRFDRSHDVKTSFNAGRIVPFFLDEVVPGDTFRVKTHKVIRLSTLITPMMDSLFLDSYYFFIPHRLVWDHWVNLNGENDNSPWADPVQYSCPQTTSPEGGWNVGTLADYLGLPTGVGNLSVSSLPFRSYVKVVNDWFRDENLCNPLYARKDDTTTTGTNTASSDVTGCEEGAECYIAAKYHDYFTSALPSPLKNSEDITIPLGSVAPVTPMLSNVPSKFYPKRDENHFESLRYGRDTDLGADFATNRNIVTDTLGYLRQRSDTSVSDSDLYGHTLTPLNLWANLSDATAATINQLRLAFQVQKMYERDARGGTRYIEMIKSHFNVTSPDARLQRSEYLGGNRVPIVVNQVVQNSETATTPQGNVTAYSLTVDSNFDFNHSFTEHGYILGVMVARYHHSYQQGINRMWSRKFREDWYLPVFANLGEQIIANKEIFAQGSSVVDAAGIPVDEKAFGYQERWAEYRYHPNQITGMMRSQYAQSLDSWHLGDDYSQLPTLSEGWIKEDKANVDRVLAVSSEVSDQFIADIYVQADVVRPLPLYSIPGLIDHH